MSRRPTGPAVARALAVVLALVGAAVTLWRPLAPPLPDAPVAQEAFAPEVLAVVGAYREPRLAVALGALAVSVLVPLAALALPAVRRGVDRLATRVVRPGAAAALVAVALVLATRLVLVGPAYWVGHVREVEWGFRTAGAGDWWRDWGLGVVVEAGTAAIAVALLWWLLRRRPGDWHWWMPLAATGLAAALTFANPLLVQPLFLDTEPLGPGEVRDAVQDVLERAGVDAEVLVGDASRRTTRVNAFVTGLGPSRQVVLWDNLVRRPTDEVAVVVAHELAHRVDLDLARGVLLTATGVLPFALVLRRLLHAGRLRRLVGADHPADPRMVLVVAVAVAAAQVLALPAAMWASRRAEAAADHLALRWTGAPDPLVRSFRGFVLRDLSDPAPPALQQLLLGSHPPLHRRTRAVVVEAERLGIPVAGLDDLRERERDEAHPRILLP